MTYRWRSIERAIVDFCRRRGEHIADIAGRPHLAAEFFDAADGQLLERQIVVDVEALARAIDDSI
jgi:hypothetical protein